MKLEMASSLSPSKPNHFFKIILSDADSQTKLMIPRKFVRKYEKDLDSRISLKAPYGLVWHVNLERQKDEVWLQDGWPEFARFYSVQFGHLLVFKYRGHCDFKVCIFDPSCTEIDYPSSGSAKLTSRESSQVRKRAMDIDHSTCSDLVRPRKKRAKQAALKDANHNGLGLMPNLQPEKTKIGDCGWAIKKAEARGLALAETFKSDKPFFVKAMRISHVDGKCHGLVVTKAFEETHVNWKQDDQVHLQVAGKSWLVNCDMKWNKCCLRVGWDEFAQDNSLSVGDVCVFELIDACTKLLQVVIFRTTKETNGSDDKTSSEVVKFREKRRLTSLCLISSYKKPNLQHERANVNREMSSKAENDKALARAKTFKSENPFFILVVKPYLCGRGRPCVPKTFEEAYKNWKYNDQIILQVAGRTSPVYCTLKVNRDLYRISPGWGVFARDNSLNVGDVCVFELIVPSRKLFQVSIFRASDEAEKTLMLTTSEAAMS
ncbi:hypothetical protein POM88_035223 [Heracleum sosnowskyi]|uniref:TF-B3 domain-containing protein n=1 Tax=Heracleum sosnowskyi TaxID=360622 RepID=A0AAD8HM17_9APIA|nr:hypothetical protein POM88_035223 [Heracleum sosnowskyi]